MKRRWTKEEEYYLQDKWGEVSIKGIAKTLGRSETGIIVRARKLGLGPHLQADHRVSLNQLILAIYGGKQQGGCTVKRWIENGLPIKTHLVKNSRFKVIDIDEFWFWAEQHKELLNFSRLEENALGKEPDWVKKKRKLDIREKFSNDPWTAADDSRLIQLLDMYKYTYDDLSRILMRTEGAIKRRICTLGLVQRPVRRDSMLWTDEEIQTLLTMKASGHCWEEIGRVLKRSGCAVRGKYERLQNPDYCTMYHRKQRGQPSEGSPWNSISSIKPEQILVGGGSEYA